MQIRNLFNYSIIACMVLPAISCRQNSSSATAEVKDAKQDKEILTDLEIIEDATTFYVIGDWGRNGHNNQQEVADMMQLAAHKLEPEFIISTGDNFYPNGIASTEDPYWKTSFEDVYHGDFLFAPWYVSLGNHDYRGNVQAEIDYSNISKRWTMPARYFEHTQLLEDDVTKAQFIFLDTSPIQDDYYGESKYADAIQDQDTTAQLAWFENALAQDSSTWKVVIGHHPLYTAGKRAHKPSYAKNHLEHRLNKYKVNAYFAGHEHDLQYHKPESANFHHFVSGAGSEVRPIKNPDVAIFAESTPGFMIVSMTKTQMLVQMVSSEGKVIYKTNINP